MLYATVVGIMIFLVAASNVEVSIKYRFSKKNSLVFIQLPWRLYSLKTWYQLIKDLFNYNNIFYLLQQQTTEKYKII